MVDSEPGIWSSRTAGRIFAHPPDPVFPGESRSSPLIMEQPSTKRSRWIWAVVLMLLPVFYVLSLGPAVALTKPLHLPLSHPLTTALIVFYYPLIYLDMNHIEPFRTFLEAYLNWWEALAGTP